MFQTQFVLIAKSTGCIFSSNSNMYFRSISCTILWFLDLDMLRNFGTSPGVDQSLVIHIHYFLYTTDWIFECYRQKCWLSLELCIDIILLYGRYVEWKWTNSNYNMVIFNNQCSTLWVITIDQHSTDDLSSPIFQTEVKYIYKFHW